MKFYRSKLEPIWHTPTKFGRNIFIQHEDMAVLKKSPNSESQQAIGARPKKRRHYQNYNTNIIIQQTGRWTLLSLSISRLHVHVLQKYERYSPRPTNVAELKEVLQEIWNSLPLEVLQKAVLSFRKRLQACIRAEGGHFEYLLS